MEDFMLELLSGCCDKIQRFDLRSNLTIYVVD